MCELKIQKTPGNSMQSQLLHLSRLKNISTKFSPTFLKYCTFIAATASARSR
jgi:hypothetical protein